jgi:hypothetical protein
LGLGYACVLAGLATSARDQVSAGPLMLPFPDGNAEHVTRKVTSRQQFPTFADLASRPVIESVRIERFGLFAGYCFYSGKSLISEAFRY